MPPFLPKKNPGTFIPLFLLNLNRKIIFLPSKLYYKTFSALKHELKVISVLEILGHYQWISGFPALQQVVSVFIPGKWQSTGTGG